MTIEQQQRIVQMRGTKADCEAFTATLEEGAVAYATDTSQYGVYTNGAFVWLSGGGGTVTNIATGTGLTGGPITTTGTISDANTAVTPATYGDASNIAQFTVNQQGRITSAANVAISVTTGHEHVYQEDLSARCNGSATLFYTANAYEADTTQVWINGVLQRPVTQYAEDTSSYDTLTLNSAPVAGDEFIVAYTMATA